MVLKQNMLTFLDLLRAFQEGTASDKVEVIGYVGATGGATGPHLHYEFLVNGIHQNPRTILDKLPKAESIHPDEMALFSEQAEKLLDQFDELSELRASNY